MTRAFDNNVVFGEIKSRTGLSRVVHVIAFMSKLANLMTCFLLFKSFFLLSVGSAHFSQGAIRYSHL